MTIADGDLDCSIEQRSLPRRIKRKGGVMNNLTCVGLGLVSLLYIHAAQIYY